MSGRPGAILADVKAWVVRRPGAIDGGPLALIDRDEPVPGPGEVRVRVTASGVDEFAAVTFDPSVEGRARTRALLRTRDK